MDFEITTVSLLVSLCRSEYKHMLYSHSSAGVDGGINDRSEAFVLVFIQFQLRRDTEIQKLRDRSSLRRARLNPCQIQHNLKQQMAHC